MATPIEPLQPPPTSRARLLPRFLLFGLAVILVVSGLTARLVHLQVAGAGYYPGVSRGDAVAMEVTSSARGLIVDRNGVQLVKNVPAFTVKIRPGDIPFSRRAEVVGRLARLLEMPPAEINERIDRNPGSRFDLVRIKTDVPPEVARVISEQRLELPGTEVIVEARREYRYGPLLGKILGYTGGITGEEWKRLREDGYLSDDTLGKAGVEAAYEPLLRGQYGLEQVERDSTGRKLRTLATVREPQTGNTLELSIDTGMQRTAEKALRWAMESAGIPRGVFLVANPQTGEVLAMVSLPSYDNNAFADGVTNAEYAAYLDDPNRPLVNLALSEQFPPGSTYKLVTGTGGLADRKVRPHTVIESRPYIEIGPYRYREHNRRGWADCCDVFDGFGHSSDVYFYTVAGMLGIDRLAHWANQYGFGHRSGIDLPGEAKGIVPTNAWKQGVFGEPIYPGEVYHAGIGQGYDATTPIQVLNAYAALANGGRLLQPQVVRRVLGPDGSIVQDFEPKLIHRMDVDADVLRTMREASRRVLTIRHTKNLVDLPLVFAGKSGTAEFGKRDKLNRLPFHSWFAAFVPKGGDPSRPDSELAVLAFAYDSRTNTNAAVEIVKYFLQLHYDLRDENGDPIDLRYELKRGNCYGEELACDGGKLRLLSEAQEAD